MRASASAIADGTVCSKLADHTKWIALNNNSGLNCLQLPTVSLKFTHSNPVLSIETG